MDELYELWKGVERLGDLPPVPPFSEFQKCYDEIDVGYDCFLAPCYVSGPYALIYDEEQYRRDLWGWSVQVSYKDETRNCWTIAMPAHKCSNKEEAYDKLVKYYEELKEEGVVK